MRLTQIVALQKSLFGASGRSFRSLSAAITYTLIDTVKLNRVDPQGWLTDALSRIADHKITRLDELLPWRYAASTA